MEYSSNFEYDLKVGQVKEKELADILQNKTIEVKKCTEAFFDIFVEYESRGKPSGINTSKADYYCIALKNSFILVETDRLKKLCEPYYNTKRDTKGGDNNTSKGIKLPIRNITE